MEQEGKVPQPLAPSGVTKSLGQGHYRLSGICALRLQFCNLCKTVVSIVQPTNITLYINLIGHKE